jgi:hypothetical protein
MTRGNRRGRVSDGGGVVAAAVSQTVPAAGVLGGVSGGALQPSVVTSTTTVRCQLDSLFAHSVPVYPCTPSTRRILFPGLATRSRVCST